MDASEIKLVADASVQVGSAPSAAEEIEYERCEECGVPVDHEQRYCVHCGAHRRHVHDPAARYLSQASVRSRATAAAAAGGARPRRRFARLGTALVLAAVLAAASIGFSIGRSSSDTQAAAARHTAPTQRAAVSTGHHHVNAGIQHATGNNYVNQAGNLPMTVSP